MPGTLLNRASCFILHTLNLSNFNLWILTFKNQSKMTLYLYRILYIMYIYSMLNVLYMLYLYMCSCIRCDIFSVVCFIIILLAFLKNFWLSFKSQFFQYSSTSNCWDRKNYGIIKQIAITDHHFKQRFVFLWSSQGFYIFLILESSELHPSASPSPPCLHLKRIKCQKASQTNKQNPAVCSLMLRVSPRGFYLILISPPIHLSAAHGAAQRTVSPDAPPRVSLGGRVRGNTNTCQAEATNKGGKCSPASETSWKHLFQSRFCICSVPQ